MRFTVLHEANGRYTAEIAIGNEGRGDLAGWEISIPIEGRAFAVDGARAFQRGRTLVLGSADLIPSGGGVAVTIAVRASRSPRTSAGCAAGAADLPRGAARLWSSRRYGHCPI